MIKRDEMSEEEFEEGLGLVKYFWQEKGDITRWSGWEEFRPVLKKKRPDLYMIIENYLDAENALLSAVRNI